MRRDDIAAVRGIESTAYDYPWSERIFRDCLRVGYRAWVIEPVDGPLAGYALASIAVGEAHLLNLCLAESARGRGLGTRLLDSLVAQARREAAAVVMLEVRPSNTAARRLYARYGFIEQGRRPGYYPGETVREDALLLSLDITP
ncbi:ribosomal-protein-alanine N-acetyltransferase [Salinisphaera sp. Q1T1-3]|nr:ribosomal-protein-alanine N-acetyltransferase [Salinisphaera sp. Q1T1-3]